MLWEDFRTVNSAGSVSFCLTGWMFFGRENLGLLSHMALIYSSAQNYALNVSYSRFNRNITETMLPVRIAN